MNDVYMYSIFFKCSCFVLLYLSVSINRYLQGGADSGFRRVEPDQYLPRLLHFHGDRHNVRVVEVTCRTFILILKQSTTYFMADRCQFLPNLLVTKYKLGINRPSTVILKSLVNKHNKTGNKCYIQDKTDTRENTSV